jgi:hypothetical protein
MQDLDDPLAKYRRPGEARQSVPPELSSSGIKLREYKAFATDARPSLLLLKRGLVRKPETDQAIPYGYLCNVISDGYGFGFSLTFALPFPAGPLVVELRGEGLTPLLEGILRGTVASVQMFDPERFLPPPEGTFDKEADEWRGVPMVREITVTDKNTPAGSENTTRH